MKHERLAADPFVLLRVTFYRSLERWPAVGSVVSPAPALRAVGDLRVENFGHVAGPRGRLVCGVNDVDKAWRLASST